jgi:hypothetical protein
MGEDESMSINVIVATSMLVGFAVAQRAQAADIPEPNPLVPVSVFTTNDIPAAESGKPVWDSTRGWGIACHDKWVYAVSAAEYVLQFECDPVTAKLTYKGATPLGYNNKDSAKGVMIHAWIRRTDDNQAKLILCGELSYSYTLVREPSSGALTLASREPDTNAGNLGILTGAPWSRQDRFAYSADGYYGYFVNEGWRAKEGPVECFRRDPATGALTLLPPIPDMGARRLVLDPVNGILFTAGEKIASFKIPAAGKPASSKLSAW